MKSHLFLFTLGPVQSFIAQARKTQDLYAGSRILAELTHVAATKAIQQNIKLIFPAKVAEGSPIPNRFIGKIADKSDHDLQEIGASIELAVQNKFADMANSALKAAETTEDERFWRQIENQWDMNWLFYPVAAEGDDNYRAAYAAIEQEMSAVKNMRFFTQNPEQGRKCSLDGERDALFFGQGTNTKYFSDKNQIIKDGLWLASNEGLSAVSLVKRGFEKGRNSVNNSFASTAEISLLQEIEKDQTIFNLYKDFIRLDEFDYQFCYKENITEKYLRKNGYSEVLERISPLALEQCRNQIFGTRELPKHYALVAFDGDQMGQIMSGAKGIFQGKDLEVFQRSVSGRLIAFAEEVHALFKSNPSWGRVVYTGGDDFLGFINLHYLFKAMESLRTSFQRLVNQPLREDGNFVEGYNFTFSAGIAMAHYKTPLSIVIHKAKELEESAKSAGRDAFALAALKHSGDSHESCYRWELGNGLTHWKALEQLTGYLEDNTCSENFARVLASSFYLFQNEKGELPNSRLVKTELLRTVKRSIHPDKKDKVQEVFQCIEKLLFPPNIETDAPVELNNFIEMLNIALFLKRVRKNKLKR